MGPAPPTSENADHPPVVGIGIHRLHRPGHEFAEVFFGWRRTGIVVLQGGQLPIQLILRLVRPLLRQVEQADGEVDDPVLQVAEGLFSGAGGLQDLDIVGFGAQRLRILLEFAAKVEAGARQDQQED